MFRECINESGHHSEQSDHDRSDNAFDLFDRPRCMRSSIACRCSATLRPSGPIPPGSVSNHVLRRSGARMMIYAGAGIVDVSTMLGHADTRTTMLYIGLTLDDLTKVQEKRDDYLDIIRMKMKVTPERTAERITLFAR